MFVQNITALMFVTDYETEGKMVAVVACAKVPETTFIGLETTGCVAQLVAPCGQARTSQ